MCARLGRLARKSLKKARHLCAAALLKVMGQVYAARNSCEVNSEAVGSALQHGGGEGQNTTRPAPPRTTYPNVQAGRSMGKTTKSRRAPRTRKCRGQRQETNLLGGLIEYTLPCENVSGDTYEEDLEDRLQWHSKRVSKNIRHGEPSRPLTSKVVLRSGPIGVPPLRSAIHGSQRDLGWDKLGLANRRGQTTATKGGRGEGKRLQRVRRACVIVKVEVASIPSSYLSRSTPRWAPIVRSPGAQPADPPSVLSASGALVPICGKLPPRHSPGMPGGSRVDKMGDARSLILATDRRVVALAQTRTHSKERLGTPPVYINYQSSLGRSSRLAAVPSVGRPTISQKMQAMGTWNRPREARHHL